MKALNEIRKSFETLPDEAILTSELASIYLGVNVKALEKMRHDGGGPPYIRHEGKNKKVCYELSDLRAYRSTLKVTTAMGHPE